MHADMICIFIHVRVHVCAAVSMYLCVYASLNLLRRFVCRQVGMSRWVGMYVEPVTRTYEFGYCQAYQNTPCRPRASCFKVRPLECGRDLANRPVLFLAVGREHRRKVHQQ